MNQMHLEHLSSPVWAEHLREELLPWVIGSHDLGDRLLEVGPGPGLTTDLLRQQVSHVTAVESDPELARQLQARLAGTNVDVIHGDASELPLPDNSFSSAACLTMLHHVESSESQDRLLGEVQRVLQPGGCSWPRTASTRHGSGRVTSTTCSIR